MKKFSYKINGSRYNVEIVKDEDNLIDIDVNGTLYTVEVERPEKMMPKIKRQAAVSSVESVSEVKKSASSVSGAIVSPLPGVILEVRVSSGDEVKKGGVVMVLEAMKMENSILADKDGVVKEIKVSKGDSVLEGADLLIIE